MKFNKLVWCLALLLAASTCFAQEDPLFTVFDVPDAATTYPVSINNVGDVAGWFCPSGYTYCDDVIKRGFVREYNGNIATFDGIPTSINDAGTVAGFLFDTGEFHCFLRDHKGNITVFDVPQPFPPNPFVAIAVAINNQGDVAGYLIPCPLCDTYQGFIRDQQGGITTFVIPKGLEPTSINARGDITGHTASYYVPEEGFVRDRNGDITVFDVAGAGCLGPLADPVSINNAGDVAGWFTDVQDCRLRGFVRTRKGSIAVFDAVPNASGTTIASINEKGDVVGAFSDVTYSAHQFLRGHKGNITVFDIPNALLATSVSINNLDDVTGILWDIDGMMHGFVRSTH